MVVEVMRRVTGYGNAGAPERLERLGVLAHDLQQPGVVAREDRVGAVGHGGLANDHHVKVLLVVARVGVSYDLLVEEGCGLRAHAANDAELSQSLPSARRRRQL